MPLIEGIGDEVTFVLGGFLLCIIMMFAWLSTHTADIPLLREVGVIVVELTQRRSQTQNSANEENNVRNDPGTGLEHGNALINNDEHEQRGQLSGQASSSIAESNIVVGVQNTASQLSGERPAKIADVTKPSHAVQEQSEAVTNTSDLKDKTNVHQASAHKPCTQAPSDDLQESQILMPKASAVVDDSKGFESPNGEEIRHRRVQYFQTNKSTDVTNDKINLPPVDKSSSLSDVPSIESEHVRQLRSSHSSSFTVTPQDEAITPGTSHLPKTVDLGNVASSSVQEAITVSQSNSIREEIIPTSKIRVKLKYMNETQRLVYAEPLDTIGDFRRSHFQSELQDNKWVRFIYNGQDLRDDARTLQACNVGDNCTMHCLITDQAQPNQGSQAMSPEEDDDSLMGAMMYPLITVIILIVWYFRFTYRQYFSAMSTVCLIGFSFLLALSYISSLRTSERIQPQRRLGPITPVGPPVAPLREQHQHID